jgi:hypothetical protein
VAEGLYSPASMSVADMAARDEVFALRSPAEEAQNAVSW